jgi:uncharacterized protein
MTKVLTSSGVLFDLLNPTADDVRPLDIYRSLAHQCRFNGHTRRHWSVAQHSVFVADIVKLWGGTPTEQLQALLHDADEAYMGDVVTPVKQLMGGWPSLVRNINRAIGERFKVELATLPQIVTAADGEALDYERTRLLPEHDSWPGVEPLDSKIRYDFDRLTLYRGQQAAELLELRVCELCNR